MAGRAMRGWGREGGRDGEGGWGRMRQGVETEPFI